MGARCDKCGYTIEGGLDCYPCQRDEARAEAAKFRRLLEYAIDGMTGAALSDPGSLASSRAYAALMRIDREFKLDMSGLEAGADVAEPPPLPDLHPGDLEPVFRVRFVGESDEAHPRGRMADGRAESPPVAAPVRTAGRPVSDVELERALLELRAEVERNRLRIVWMQPAETIKPHEHELHGKPCCNPKCGGKWGANCPHCHRLDHRCESDLGPK